MFRVVSIATYPLLVVALTVFLYHAMKEPTTPSGNNTHSILPSPENRIIPHHHYLVCIALAEADSRERFESGNRAPDLFYELLINETLAYQSKTIKNSLIARWDAYALSVDLSLQEGVHSSPEVNTHAARLAFAPDDVLTVRIIDSDPLRNDRLLEQTFTLKELAIGDSIIPGNTPLIKKYILRIVDAEQERATIIEALKREPVTH